MIRELKGFTLVEILIVVAIIAILASIVLVGLSGIQQRARDARRISDLNQIQNAIALYYTKHGLYPNTSTFTGSTGLKAMLLSSTENLGLTNIPDDPTDNWHYGYCSPPGNTQYVLGAYLEDASDPSLVVNDNSLDSICTPNVTGGSTVNSCSSKTKPTNLYCTTVQ